MGLCLSVCVHLCIYMCACTYVDACVRMSVCALHNVWTSRRCVHTSIDRSHELQKNDTCISVHTALVHVPSYTLHQTGLVSVHLKPLPPAAARLAGDAAIHQKRVTDSGLQTLFTLH